MTATLSEAWRHAWADTALRTQIVVTPVGLVVTLRTLATFLVWVESRQGTPLADPLLAAVAPRDGTWVIFAMIYLGILISLAVLIRHPRAMLIGVQAYIVMLLARICMMYVTPLDPPFDMIALRDPVIEIFGRGRVLTRDLFFSGHTGTVFLLFLAVPDRRFKPVLFACTIAVAVGVLWQHVHYTVDVMVAPFVAFASYRAVRALHDLQTRPAAHEA